MKPIYEQKPGESEKAFAAFKTYRDMGPQRSFRIAARKLKKSVTQLTRWSGKFLWPERLKAWSAHLGELENAAIDVEARKKAQEWAKREQAQRERRWALGELLMKRAEAMLEFPLATTKSKDGKTIVNPTAWNMGQSARLAEVGDKLVALAVGEATERTEITGKDGSPIAPTGIGTVIILPAKKLLPDDEES